ncbi:putative protein kinase TKL-Pl-4 family [Helianthus annuus]|nr:putative protein kinase TKL-Pl-4 family [Helianthus annuus]
MSKKVFVAACRQPQVFCIITEYLSEGSLRAYLHKLEDNTGKERISSVRKAYPDGFKYYSWNGIHPFARHDPGTYRWMAPEMIKRKSYGRKVDVYGFGRILWQMVAGTIPYKDMTPIQAAFAAVHKVYRLHLSHIYIGVLNGSGLAG